MKRVHSFIQKYILMSVLLAVSLTMAAQDRTLFTARAQENQNRQLRYTFITSDTIPLEGFGTIYSLSIDATINQPREASFTRVVLEDKDGHDYLVAESDWFRNDSTTVTLDHYCEETALLDGITPIRLKCYVAGNAVLSLNGIHFSDQPATRKDGKPIETVKNMKEAQVKNIVERINTYNKKNNRHWIAAVTNISTYPYNELKNVISQNSIDSYLNNIIYYGGGLYEVGIPKRNRYVSNSPFVPNFDWRNRHGVNWLTSVKNQMGSGYCTVFAAVSMLEANMNLYYNSKIDLDLSEQYVASYGGVDYNLGTIQEVPVEFLKRQGTIDDASMPFQNDSNYIAPAQRPVGNMHVYLKDYHKLYTNTMPLDTLKKYIIQKGPGVCGFWSAPPSIWRHSMNLVGYGIIEPDTAYKFFNGSLSDTTYHVGDTIIGHTYWIYKNSWGPNSGHNGYMYIIYYNDNNWFMGYDAYFPKGVPHSNISYQVICEDRDGDGLFNWGIGPKPAHCPAWAPDESDGDDSDWTLGHMNEYGFCDTLSYTQPVYEYIYNDSTFTSSTSVAKNLGVMRGATLTLNAHLTLSNGSKLLLDNGATLVIEGTYLSGSKIQAYPGSKIILNNNAWIKKPFEVPDGVELIINYGRME